MKPNKYEMRTKSFIKMQEEVDKLREELKNLPLVPYKEPIHHGWYVIYELREDISRRNDAYDIQQVVDIGYRPRFIRNVKHVKMMRAGMRGYYDIVRGKKCWIPFGPDFTHLKQREFDKIPEPLQKYFVLDRYSSNPGLRNRYKVFIPDFWLVLKARPRFITHFKDIGGEKQRRYQYLRDRLEEYWRTAKGSRTNWNHKGYTRNPYRHITRDSLKQFLKNEREDVPSFTNKEIKR